MVDDLALGCRSTGPGTRVATLLSDTGQVAWTLTVEDTLRSTVGRDSDISGQAGAGRDASLVPALREGATGVRQAGIDRDGWSGGSHGH